MSTSDTEKAATEELKQVDTLDTQDEVLTHFTPQEQKRIIRRVDRRLVLTLGALYCVSLVDRTNLGSAVIAGYSTWHSNIFDFTYIFLGCMWILTFILSHDTRSLS
jgi:hypothetical protein